MSVSEGWRRVFRFQPDCNIAEVAVYDRALDDAERSAIETALQETYGIGSS